MLWVALHFPCLPPDALAPLAAWTCQFTPKVSLEPPGELLLEVQGSLRLFGGFEILKRKLDAGLRELAMRCVAGQPYFANAHVHVALVARFERCFWKYRYHSKAYRVLALEAGTIAQTIYLRATELGLGAFVTAAINEVEIERAFGLDALDESPITVCGFGIRGAVRERVEFDPNREVWRD